ncbi:MAG: hypothetical protein V7754_16385 [Halioglobus sp.]
MKKVILFVCFACVAASATQAQGIESEVEKRNFIEVFVGVTHDDGENEASLGVTYERKFGRFGTGIIAEFTKAESRESVFALPFFWHPAEPWRTVVAIGVEDSDDGDSFLARVGASYEIEFSGWSLSPEVNFDFVDDSTVLVFGASFVWKF